MPVAPRHALAAGALAAISACGDPAPTSPPPAGCAADAAAIRGVVMPDVLWALEASGPSDLLDLAPTDGGGAIVTGLATGTLELAGQAIAAGATPTLFTVELDGDGRGRWRRLVAGGRRLERAIAVPSGAGAPWLVVATVGDLVLDPAGAAAALDLSDDQVTVLVLRVDADRVARVATITGDLERVGLIAAPGADGGLLLGGSAGARLDVAIGADTVRAPVEAAATWPGHGWLVRLDRDGLMTALQRIDGAAGSVVTGTLELDDGRLAVTGRFGGFGALTARFGAGPTAPELVAVSSDDDPALDAFVALTDPTGAFTAAHRVRSYHLDDPVVIAPTATGFITQVASTGYDTVYGDDGPSPVRITADHSLGGWDHDGRLDWAAATAAYTLHDAATASAHPTGDGWVAQPGAIDEVRVALDPTGEDWLLAALGPRGVVAGVGHLVARGTTGDPVLSLVRPACGGRWLVGGSPYGRPTLVGRAGDVELPRDAGAQRRILVGAIGYPDSKQASATDRNVPR